MSKRNTKKNAVVKTSTVKRETVPTITLVIDSWLAAKPDAPPVDPTATVGARNYGRYSGKKCGVWQRWVMTDCRDDQRTDDEICDVATVEFAVSSHVVSHNGRFPTDTVRAMRREYNAGIRGRIVDGPVPQWFKNSDGTRYGMLRVRDGNGKWTVTPYEPTA
jgi:hypothetical protein